ncbi:MAG: type I-C CRISPR-associated protein Cas8c/Csd1 [Clostridiales bacterium]|nr:type I-C CRISPR-associated protein Cas8c/Csd1 [Clostridiales bacterium]
MLINALNQYYDMLSRAGKVCPEGISKQKVSHMIMLRPDGSISSITDIRRQSKPDKKGKTKLEMREIDLPERTQKPGIDFNIIEHRPLYIFGLNYDKKTGEFSPEDKTMKAKKSHECFVKGNLDFTEGMSSEIVKAYRNFISRWKPEEETENKHLKQLGKDYDGGYFCFALDGNTKCTLHDMDGEIMKKVLNSPNTAAEPDGICAVTGEWDQIARIHDKVQGIAGGQASGCSLVCFKGTAVESYGKTQSYNSSISQSVMKRYTQALNILLKDRTHKMYLEDLTVVFWAMSEDDSAETDMFSMLMEGDKADSEQTDKAIFNAMRELGQGRQADLAALNIDENVEFYIAGLAPNNSRIAQKFVYRDKFGKIFENLARHQADMLLEDTKAQIPLWRICSELKSPKSNKEKTPPPLLSAMFTAILNGTRYPDALLETAVRRVKTDKFVNYVRAGIIKACINRKVRINNETEEIKMALDKENINQAYLCGRLFAVLERVQKNAAKTKLDRTIKDSYFASACAKPATVFPKLMVLAQYHLGNDDFAVADNKLMGEITDKLCCEFPQTLPLNEQGRFILGYYHQNQDFYKKSSDKTEISE